MCETCGNQMKKVPAGISKKTGKSYKEFYVCETCKPKQGSKDNTQEHILTGLRSIFKLLEETNKILEQIRDK